MYVNKMYGIRKQKKITLAEISKKTGISVGYLSHLENGTRNNPSIEIMNKIANVLELSVAEVFFED